MTLLGDMAALIALSLSLLFSFSMFAAVLTSTYVRMVTAGGDPGFVTRVLAEIDRTGIGNALARGGLMVVLFIVAALMLASAGTRARKLMARAFSVLYTTLAVLLMLLGVSYLDNSAYSVRDFVSVTGVALVLVLFSIVLATIGDIPAWLPYFGVPFIAVLLLHALLLTFTRAITPDLYFAGRLLIFVVIGLIVVAYRYAGALIDAAA
jgi:hypothetical protein